MNKKRIHGFMIDLKNTFVSRSLWESVFSVALLSFTLPSRGCLLDRLFEMLKGPIYQFMRDGSLTQFMSWMMPHTLLSVIIGKETEVLLNCLQFRLPRYRARSSFWFSHSLKTAVVCVAYYSLLSALAVGFAALAGHTMPGASGQMGGPVLIDNNNTYLLLILLLIRVCLPMCAILQIQSFFHIAFRSAFWGGISFVLFIAVPAFLPEGSFSGLFIGNWLIWSRSAYAASEYGISMTAVLLGTFVSLLLVQGLGAGLFRSKNWY